MNTLIVLFSLCVQPDLVERWQSFPLQTRQHVYILPVNFINVCELIISSVSTLDVSATCVSRVFNLREWCCQSRPWHLPPPQNKGTPPQLRRAFSHCRQLPSSLFLLYSDNSSNSSRHLKCR